MTPAAVRYTVTFAALAYAVSAVPELRPLLVKVMVADVALFTVTSGEPLPETTSDPGPKLAVTVPVVGKPVPVKESDVNVLAEPWLNNDGVVAVITGPTTVTAFANGLLALLTAEGPVPTTFVTTRSAGPAIEDIVTADVRTGHSNCVELRNCAVHDTLSEVDVPLWTSVTAALGAKPVPLTMSVAAEPMESVVPPVTDVTVGTLFTFALAWPMPTPLRNVDCAPVSLVYTKLISPLP